MQTCRMLLYMQLRLRKFLHNLIICSAIAVNFVGFVNKILIIIYIK